MNALAWLRRSLALVGGGSLAADLLAALRRQDSLELVAAVAESDEAAPAAVWARGQGLPVTGDVHDLYALPGLAALVEVTGDDAVLADLLRTAPPHLIVIDHTRAALVAAGELDLLSACPPPLAVEVPTLSARQLIDTLEDGIAVLNRDYEIVAANRALEKMVGQVSPLCWRGEKRPCPDCRVKCTFEAGEPQHVVMQAQSGRWIELITLPLRDERGEVALVIEQTRDITERERARQALTESEEKYRSLVERSLMGVYLIQGGVFVFVNPRLAEIFGYEREELVGMSPLAVVAPEDRALVAEKARERLEGEVTWLRYSFRGLTRQGRIIDVEVMGSRTTWQGQPAVHGSLADVTEHRRAERERDRLFNLSVDLLMIAGLDGTPKQVNPAWTATLDWTTEELLGRSWAQFVHPDDRERTLAAMAELAAGKPLPSVESRYLCRDGGWRWIAWSAFPLPEEGLIFAVGRDITDRKEAEEALAESEERYRLLVENSPDCIKMLDLEGRYLSINRAGAEALGRPASEIIGRGYEDEACEADRPALREAIGRAASGETVSFEGKDTAGRVWAVTLVPLRGARGRVERLLGVARDVTERRLAEEATRAANAELAHLNRLKDEFLSMASHELKTPITSIKLFAELATRRPEQAAARMPEVLGTVRRQADHLVSLVNDLLDVSRLELGRVRLELEPCDLTSLLSEVCMLSREIYAGRPLECRLPQQSLFVLADRSRLMQVLQNLLDNAVKYGAPDTPIAVSLEGADRQATIAVIDRGPGIAPQDLPHIFDRFYKPERLRATTPGLGLGLYISRELVRRHDGRIWAESSEGQGSTFFVELPLHDPGPLL